MNPRIIEGEYKNRRLKVPKDARPLTDRVKKTIFDILDDFVKDSTILDLFAGSGNFGIECLSRGAKFVQFNDKDERAIEVIKNNLRGIGVPQDKYDISKLHYKDIYNLNLYLDLVFIDPPFHLGRSVDIEDYMDLLNPMGLIVAKWPAEVELNPEVDGLKLLREKKLGVNYIYIWQKQDTSR